jgi:hypothetical protein
MPLIYYPVATTRVKTANTVDNNQFTTWCRSKQAVAEVPVTQMSMIQRRGTNIIPACTQEEDLLIMIPAPSLVGDLCSRAPGGASFLHVEKMSIQMQNPKKNSPWLIWWQGDPGRIGGDWGGNELIFPQSPLILTGSRVTKSATRDVGP